MLRPLVKGAVERALIWSGLARFRRRRLGNRVVVLAYHNIVPDGSGDIGDRPNHLPVSVFAAQLDALQQTHDIIPLSEALAGRAIGRRPRAVITFDDAYRGATVLGVGELSRRGIPATIFVAPAFIGGQSFWWDALAHGQRDGLDATIRHRALVELQGRDAEVRNWARVASVQIASPPSIACAASEAELRAAAEAPGITLGSHTWGHPNLTRLAPGDLTAELVQSAAWLRERAKSWIPWLAYPYGLHDATVRKAASAAGYEGALAVSGGWFPAAPRDCFSLPRINVSPGMSRRGFSLRISGLLTD